MKLVFLSLFFGIFSTGFSQEATVEINVHPIDNAGLSDYNFDRENYLDYQKAFVDSIHAFFSDYDFKQDVKIIRTLDPKVDPYYAFSGKPALHDTVRHALQKKLMSVNPINALYLPYSTEFLVHINGGAVRRGLRYSPLLKKPFDLRRAAFETADLKESFDFIQKWTLDGVLPILVAIMNQKPAVLKNTLGTKELTPAKLLMLQNDAYRFSAELAEGYPEIPQLAPMLKTLFLVSKGQFDYAKNYMQYIYQFEPPNTLTRYLMDELNWRLNYYYSKENALLQTEQVYLIDSVLLVNTNSTQALYKRLEKEKHPITSDHPFHEMYRRFERSNPMRTLTFPAGNKIDAYENHLRLEMENLFIDAETFDNSFPRCAEIALELGNYAFAKDCYLMLRGGQDIDERELFREMDRNHRVIDEEAIAFYELRYEYAYSKLPGAEVVTDKKKKKQFKRLDKKFRKRRKKHPTYKKFKS